MKKEGSSRFVFPILIVLISTIIVSIFILDFNPSSSYFTGKAGGGGGVPELGACGEDIDCGLYQFCDLSSQTCACNMGFVVVGGSCECIDGVIEGNSCIPCSGEVINGTCQNCPNGAFVNDTCVCNENYTKVNDECTLCSGVVINETCLVCDAQANGRINGSTCVYCPGGSWNNGVCEVDTNNDTDNGTGSNSCTNGVIVDGNCVCINGAFYQGQCFCPGGQIINDVCYRSQTSSNQSQLSNATSSITPGYDDCEVTDAYWFDRTSNVGKTPILIVEGGPGCTTEDVVRLKFFEEDFFFDDELPYEFYVNFGGTQNDRFLEFTFDMRDEEVMNKQFKVFEGKTIELYSAIQVAGDDVDLSNPSWRGADLGGTFHSKILRVYKATNG